MFNEKLARQMMAQKERRHIDAIDLEAERIGNANRTERDYGPTKLGRRISKTTRQLNGRRTTAETIASKNAAKDASEMRAKYVIGSV